MYLNSTKIYKIFGKLLFFFLCLAITAIISITAPPAISAEEDNIAELQEKAKKEGKAVLYTAWGWDTVNPLVKAFQKKYPFIKTEVFRTRSEKLLVRVSIENSKQRYIADVFAGSALMMFTLKKESRLQPYISPGRKAFIKEYKDTEGYWTSCFYDTHALTYNTKLISSEEAPESYEALLDPKWKGKIGMDQREYIWFASQLEIMGRDRGLSFMKKFARQQIDFRSGHSLLIQLLAAGEFSVITVGFGSTIEKYKVNGAPIEWLPINPIVTSLYPAGIAANAPHSNSARLFIDFLLSREGQETLKIPGKTPCSSDVEPLYPGLTKGLKLFPVKPTIVDNYEQVVSEFREIFFKQR
ncbi:ABC transporter substrate-binding protein [Thermodesulfobacteriota bacterium]